MGCLVVAAGVAGYVGWLLWGTGLETARAQDTLRSTFERSLGREDGATEPAGPILPGRAYAEIRIPEIGLDMIVVQGTTYGQLKKGPGHYVDTADPWDATGRVGIAGHRTTYLAPFFSLDELGRGDRIALVTTRGTFRYEVRRAFVVPEEGSGRVLRQTERPTLVLTTCNPRYASYERLIVTADRV
jgi:LPXTG-site transpeptidase (sortase) family protein